MLLDYLSSHGQRAPESVSTSQTRLDDVQLAREVTIILTIGTKDQIVLIWQVRCTRFNQRQFQYPIASLG
jgi:hypothetical protein